MGFGASKSSRKSEGRDRPSSAGQPKSSSERLCVSVTTGTGQAREQETAQVQSGGKAPPTQVSSSTELVVSYSVTSTDNSESRKVADRTSDKPTGRQVSVSGGAMSLPPIIKPSRQASMTSLKEQEEKRGSGGKTAALTASAATPSLASQMQMMALMAQNNSNMMAIPGRPKAKVRKPAPPFSCTALMPSGDFQKVSLEQYLGRYLVLFFYPGDFTFVCPTEIVEFSNRRDEFDALQCGVLACSVDSEYCHKAWVDMPRARGGLGNITIPILADLTKQVASDYDVLLEEDGVATRGLFIIDRKGIVRQITINDLPVGRSVNEVKRLVEAFQFTDIHGNVCPQGWSKGKKTIIPNPKDSLQYFQVSKEMEQSPLPPPSAVNNLPV